MEDNYRTTTRRPTGSATSERSTGQMQGLLSEFRGLYESRLRKLDDAERAGEDIQKVCIMAESSCYHFHCAIQ